MLLGRLKPLPALFPEEERSKQPSAFSHSARADRGVPRRRGFAASALVGAFGYDLLFQFDPIEQKLPRDGHKDLHLFLCDDIYFMDRKKEQIERYQYDFARGDVTTARPAAHRREARAAAQNAKPGPIVSRPHAGRVHGQGRDRARGHAPRRLLRSGAAPDLPHALLRQGRPSCFERIQHASPSPYEFLLQFGDEQLIGASPEMFVRVEGHRVETCPIAGTARRTGDPLRDADNIRELLNSTKEESELTMCTDVDRNDKSRVCEPGSVKVIGRRLIESYAGVFHTVDHVEGTLQEGFDSLDAFLTHMWAVTMIGAPKKGRRAGHRESGEGRARLVRRRGRHDLAQWRYQHRHPDSHQLICAMASRAIRAGATLLYDSDPGHGRARDAPEGHRLLPRARRRRSRKPRRHAPSANARRRRPNCCWSITTTASSTRWPTTRARPAPKW